MTANLIDIYNERKFIQAQNAAAIKLSGVTAVNLSGCCARDMVFAKLWGASNPAQATRKIPFSTVALFLCRDSLTIAGGFTLPPIVSLFVQQKFNMEKHKADKIV